MPKRVQHEEGAAFRKVCHARQQTPSTNGAADTHDRPHWLPLHRPVDGRASDPEQVGVRSSAVLPALKQGHQVRFLPAIELGLLAMQTPFGLGDLYALLGAQPNQADSATIASTLKSSRPTGSVASYTDPSRLRRTWPAVSSSAIALAPGSDRASRSSRIGHTR